MANLDGTAGNDVLSGTSDDDVISGFDGDDNLNGAGGNDTLVGGSGTNVLFGGPGNDQLYLDGVDDDGSGAENNDTVHVGASSGAATIIGGNIAGGSGTDSLIFYDATFDPTSSTAQFSAFESVSGTIYGTAGNDSISLNLLFGAGIEASTLTINGGDGDDFVFGGSEMDSLHGGEGNDELNGGLGHDTLYGEGGNDELGGGEGHNTLYGGDGNDILTAGAGGDVLYSGNGTNNLYAGYGNDILYADGVDDSVNGGANNDTVHIGSLAGAAAIVGGAVTGGTEVDSLIFYNATFDATSGSASFTQFEAVSGALYGTLGNDVLNLGGLTDTALAASQLTIRGGGGNDTVTGGAQIDLIFGENGDDVVAGGANGDELQGGAGIDTLRYSSSSAGVAISLAAGTASGGDAEGDVFAGFENLVGSAFADALVGSGGNNMLDGGAGDDTIKGGNGNDTLIAGAGIDTLVGGKGADGMQGGAGDDTYYVDDAADQVTEAGAAGWDVVRAGIDFVLGANVEELVLGGAARDGTGNTLDNIVRGSGSNNLLLGLGGADTVRGGGGRDTIDGGAGADVLDGGVGKDTLTGGAGRDVFQFRDGDFGTTRSLADLITDFSHVDAEKIQLNLADADTGTAGDQAFAFIGNGAFTSVAGQLHYAHQGGNTYVEGDTNGDGTADIVVALTGTIILVAGDFVL